MKICTDCSRPRTGVIYIEMLAFGTLCEILVYLLYAYLL